MNGSGRRPIADAGHRTPLAWNARVVPPLTRRGVRVPRIPRRRPQPETHPTRDHEHDCAAAGHRFGLWGACACDQAIAAHSDPFAVAVAGWCGWEHRRCRACPRWQERRAAELPTEPGQAAR
jgi:hypothetical protein